MYGGYNGGGSSGFNLGAGGGGASSIIIGTTYIVVAGGGGGGKGPSSCTNSNGVISNHQYISFANILSSFYFSFLWSISRWRIRE